MSARTNPPNDNSKSLIPVLRTKPGPGLKVVILSTCWVWVPTHYSGKRTVVCNDDASCEWCKKQVQTWKGFMVVREYNGQRHALLSVTPNVVEVFRQNLEKNETMNGWIVHFTRLGNEVNSPLHANILGRMEGVPAVRWEETLQHVTRLFKWKPDQVLLSTAPLAPVFRLRDPANPV
ncbi:MAG: hypothetical protein OEY63_02135 [Gemmatimonadota bacterium]|nr:hypothetical protein [Gemmatimonadota bacterium]